MKNLNPRSTTILQKLVPWLLWGSVIFGTYALSSGPALRLAQKRIVPTEIVMGLYMSPLSPLGVAVNVVPGAETLLMFYLSLWAVPEPATTTKTRSDGKAGGAR